MQKTNIMRLLDSAKIKYFEREYDSSITNGEEVATIVGIDKEQCFKTLVTIASNKNYYVFCIPVNHSLNLKKAAKAVGVKSIEMIPQKNLLPLTGYVHGGCSPIGMKKLFKTVINDTAILFDYICVSGGKVGLQIQINPEELANYINAIFVDVID